MCRPDIDHPPYHLRCETPGCGVADETVSVSVTHDGTRWPARCSRCVARGLRDDRRELSRLERRGVHA
jgi:hypothetical protein